jgi:hypothetical protein
VVGAIAQNLHEGSRSEYLAQYIFASFGTVVPVPHHEDSGIDLYCTLTERLGTRAWPWAYYTVQVKSTLDPWVFGSQESVRWLIHHPLPVLLCIVEKADARIRLYQTLPRFYVWSMPPLPESLTLIPETKHEGECTMWDTNSAIGRDWNFTLSAPILDFSVSEFLKDGFHETAKSVLKMWLEIERSNLTAVNAGLHSFEMPATYRTNSAETSARVVQGITCAPKEELAQSTAHVKRLLSWLPNQLRRNSDMFGAALGALLLRHLGDDHPDPLLHERINAAVGRDDYLFAGVDELKHLIDEKIGPAGAG